MPELPEVETIVRTLRHGGRDGPAVLGLTVASVDVRWERSIAVPNAREFAAQLPGRTIRQIDRRGKFLVFTLESAFSPANLFMLVHLRMSGDLRVSADLFSSEGHLDSYPGHDRVVFIFNDRTRLAFNDPRKFGRIWLVSDPLDVLGGLGPEPLDPALTESEFYDRLTARSRQLKPLLLDQSFLAGLGNIYTDEALHLARLHPAQASSDLSPEQAARLLDAIRTVLNQGIRAHGASIDWVYRGGNFQNQFRAYRRTGQPCPVCGTPIERIIVAQRSTHYCPHCQVVEALH
jgi:formamidopyrimidine-DNA glycosylase